MDQPFTVAESPTFRSLIEYCNPTAKFLSADTVRSDIEKSFFVNRHMLREKLKVFTLYFNIIIITIIITIIIIISCLFQEPPHKISLTLDGWTSPTSVGFLSVTGHFVDREKILQNVLLDFLEIEGSHTRENMARTLFRSIEELEIADKVNNSNFYLIFY